MGVLLWRQNEQGWPADCQEPAKKKESLKIAEAFCLGDLDCSTVPERNQKVGKNSRLEREGNETGRTGLDSTRLEGIATIFQVLLNI